MGYRSNICKTKDGLGKMTFHTEREALEFISSVDQYLIDIVAYKCKKCSKYHTMPEDRYVNYAKNKCFCIDSNNNIKEAYESKDDAIKARANLENKDNLRIYQCKDSNWHLTSK